MYSSTNFYKGAYRVTTIILKIDYFHHPQNFLNALF